MELRTTVTPATAAQTTKEARGAATLAAGEALKVELGPELELDVAVPAGKSWLATVYVHIVESAA